MHRTHYTDFADLLENVRFGFKAIHEATRIDYVQRIGMRYIDLITPQDTETVSDYVAKRLLGFDPQVKGVTTEVHQQFVAMRSSAGMLVAKCYRGFHQHPLPIDLMQNALTIRRKPDSARESIILDFDHFADNIDLDANIDLVAERVSTLQAPMADVFRAALTEYAVNKFQPLKHRS